MRFCCIMSTTFLPAEKKDSPVMAILTTAKSVTHSMMCAMTPIKHDKHVASHLKLEFSSCALFVSHSEKRRIMFEIVKIRLLNTKEPKEGPIANLAIR